MPLIYNRMKIRPKMAPFFPLWGIGYYSIGVQMALRVEVAIKMQVAGVDKDAGIRWQYE